MLTIYEVEGLFKQDYSPFAGYTGFMVRGALGYALRRLVCGDLSSECRECSLIAKCFYAYFFETSSAIKHDARLAVKSGRSGVTKPYTVSPISVRGRRLKFTLTLFGSRALQAEPVLVSSIISMGSRGLGLDASLGDRRRFEVLEIRAFDPLTSSQRLVYNYRRGYLYQPARPCQTDLLSVLKERGMGLAASKPRLVTLNLQTPTQVRVAGRPVDNPSLRSIIANLARKYSLLAHYHDLGQSLTVKEAKEVIELAEQAQPAHIKTRRVKLKKHSLKEGKVKDFGPFLKGHLTYSLPPTLWKSPATTLLFALLILGQYTGIGSLTTAGCGKYNLTLSFTS